MGGDFPSRYCSATDQSPAPPSTPPPSALRKLSPWPEVTRPHADRYGDIAATPGNAWEQNAATFLMLVASLMWGQARRPSPRSPSRQYTPAPVAVSRQMCHFVARR